MRFSIKDREKIWTEFGGVDDMQQVDKECAFAIFGCMVVPEKIFRAILCVTCLMYVVPFSRVWWSVAFSFFQSYLVYGAPLCLNLWSSRMSLLLDTFWINNASQEFRKAVQKWRRIWLDCSFSILFYKTGLQTKDDVEWFHVWDSGWNFN